MFDRPTVAMTLVSPILQFYNEGDIGVCGIAVLDHFSCGISGFLISNCDIAVFSGPAGYGFLSTLGDIKNYRLSPATFSELSVLSDSFFRLFRKLAETGSQTSSVKQIII